MPWGPGDAQRHTHKATTARLQRQWADVANGELKSHGDDKRAIRAANGVIARATAAKPPAVKHRGKSFTFR